MSSEYLETPFDKFLIFEINDALIDAVTFSDVKKGSLLSSYIKSVMLNVFETKDVALFDYTLLNISSYNDNQKSIHDFLKNSQRGQIITYSDVALSLYRNKKYARAVGKILNANKFIFVVPCHRVVGKHFLGGYKYGSDLKKKILIWEGVKLNGNMNFQQNF